MCHYTPRRPLISVSSSATRALAVPARVQPPCDRLAPRREPENNFPCQGPRTAASFPASTRTAPMPRSIHEGDLRSIRHHYQRRSHKSPPPWQLEGLEPASAKTGGGGENHWDARNFTISGFSLCGKGESSSRRSFVNSSLWYEKLHYSLRLAGEGNFME